MIKSKVKITCGTNLMKRAKFALVVRLKNPELVRKTIHLLENVHESNLDDTTIRLRTVARQWSTDEPNGLFYGGLKSRLWHKPEPITNTDELYRMMNDLFAAWQKIDSTIDETTKIDVMLGEILNNASKWKGNHPWGLDFARFE